MDRSRRIWMVLLLAAVLLGACTSETSKRVSELNTLLDQLRQEYVPDDRIQWWELSAEDQDGSLVVLGELSSRETYEAVVRELESRYPEIKFEVVLLSEEDPGPAVNALVNNSVIHLRREPSSTRELVTQALLGAPVRILKSRGGKSLVQVPDGYMGWVNSAEVHPLDREGLEAYREAEKVIFNAQYGLSYSEADEASMPVSDLVIGNILSKVTEQSGFTRVEYPDGRQGWVRSKELVPAEEIFYKEPLPEMLVKTALRYHGIPYLWGGTSSKNIDCSGLVSNVYFLNGIQLPRDADMQALIGRELGTVFVPDGLEPGDLLFFGRKATEEEKENVTHVAMYIGKGEYIHSAGYHERVSINSMDSTREHYIETYPEIFVRAVRLLGEEYEGFQPISENSFYKEIIASKE
ncbi:MAG: C40 family peptidase [Bacteroidales bacterium]|nr:C40 family peptidase [Bacteroidales bacterium]